MILATGAALLGLSSGAIATGVGGLLVNKGINTYDKNKERQHELEMTQEKNKDYQERLRINGEIETNKLRINNEYNLENLKANYTHEEKIREIDSLNEIKKIGLSNDRYKDEANHAKEMKEIENHHTEEMKKLNNEKECKELEIKNETLRIENERKDTEEKKKNRNGKSFITIKT